MGFRYPYEAADGREDFGAPPSIARVSRGGSWYSNHSYSRTALRSHDSLPDYSHYLRGLRLVALPPVS